MRRYLFITKALSDSNRVRMLCALRGGELCVCQLIEMLELAASTVSKHLSILHQADLIESRKEKRWVFYRLPEKYGAPFAESIVKATFEELAKDPVILKDEELLQKIRAQDAEELCRRMRSKK